MKKLGSDFPPERYLCPRGLIEANPDMKTIVNPATDELKILREYKEFLKYCEDCSERDSCTQECRDRIKEIFTSFPTYSQN